MADKGKVLYYKGDGSGIAEPQDLECTPNVAFIEKKPKPPTYTTLSLGTSGEGGDNSA